MTQNLVRRWSEHPEHRHGSHDALLKVQTCTEPMTLSSGRRSQKTSEKASHEKRASEKHLEGTMRCSEPRYAEGSLTGLISAKISPQSSHTV